MNEKRTGSAYDKCNIFVVICARDIEVMTSTCFLLHLLFIYSLIEKTVTVNNIINHNKIT